MGCRGCRRGDLGGGGIAAQGEVKQGAIRPICEFISRAIHPRIQVKANKLNKMNDLHLLFVMESLVD
jgi:hypothetical protein